MKSLKVRNKVFDRDMNHARDPLTIKGSIERIALLPLNYTRYNSIIATIPLLYIKRSFVEQGNQSIKSNRCRIQGIDSRSHGKKELCHYLAGL